MCYSPTGLTAPHAADTVPAQGWTGGYSVWSATPSLPPLFGLLRLAASALDSRGCAIDSVSVQPIVAVGSQDMLVDLHPPLATYIFYACRPNTRLDAFLKPSHGHHQLPPAVLSRVYAALVPSINTGALSQR
jgi:hypothetical protein